jgi:hypothetical protein
VRDLLLHGPSGPEAPFALARECRSDRLCLVAFSVRPQPGGMCLCRRACGGYSSASARKYSDSRLRQGVCHLTGSRSELRRPISDLVLALRV